VQALLRDENSILTVSSLMRGQHGIEDVCLSLPSIVNADGISAILELPLNEQEAGALHASASTLKDARAGSSFVSAKRS
jgi:L-lactate dehydrogenase